MATHILGPSNPVPCDNPVVVQCLVRRQPDGHFPVYPNHPAFTDNVDDQRNLVRSTLCHSEEVHCVEIFCSTADRRFHDSPPHGVRFVGVVASFPTPHGASHGHVSVFVRGAVTMACDTTEWRERLDLRAGMFAVQYVPRERGARRFAGYPAGFTPPVVRPANAAECSSMMGTVIEVGRAPSNEVRILLAPEENYANNITVAVAAQLVLDDSGDRIAAVQGLSLDTLLNAATEAADDLRRLDDGDAAASELEQACEGPVTDVAQAIFDAAAALLRLRDPAAVPAADEAKVLTEILSLAARAAGA